MFNKGKYCIAIDIGSKNIKIVNGRLVKNKIEVNFYHIIPTPENSIKDGIIAEMDNLAEALKKVIKENNVKTKKVMFTVSGAGIITREVQIPSSEFGEIRKKSEQCIQKYFSVDISRYILDFKIQEEIKVENHAFVKVLFVAVPAAQIESYMLLIEKIRLQVERIDLPANCITKFLFGGGYARVKANQHNIAQNDCICVIDFGAENTEVYVFIKNKLKSRVVIPIGSSSIDREISKEFRNDLAEAEQKKIINGRIDKETEELELSDDISKLEKSISNSMATIISKLKDFFAAETKGIDLHQIYICGGGSKLLGLDIYLSNVLDVPVAYLRKSYFNIKYTGNEDYYKISEDFIFLVNAIGAIVED